MASDPKAKVIIEADGAGVSREAAMVGKALEGVDRGIKNAFTRGIKDSGDALEGLARKAGTAFGMISNPAVLAAGAIAGLGTVAVKVGKQSLDLAASFETAMANVSTLVTDATIDMEAMSDGVLSLSGKLGQPATELADGLYQVISAGVPAANALQFLETSAKAAKAGMTTTFVAVDGLTTVINAFGLSTSDAGRVADIMFKTVEKGKTTFPELADSIGRVAPMAAQANISIEELFSAVGTLTLGGMKTSEAVTYLRSAIANIMKPSEEAQKAAKKLGIEFDLNSLQSKGLAGFLDMVRVATEKDNEAAIKLFGSQEALSAVMALTGKQAGVLRDVINEVTNASGAADTAYGKMMDTYNEKMNLVRTKFDELGTRIGIHLLPIVERLVDWLLKAVGWVERIFGLQSTAKATSGNAGSSNTGASSVPQFAGGGVMPWDGLAYLHKNERVLTQQQYSTLVGGVNVYIQGGVDAGYDGARAGEAIAAKLRLQGAV